MASKKITKAPSGKSFMYEPQAPYGAAVCPDCGKGEVVMTRGSFPTCNGGAHFTCSKRCGWKSASGKFQHTPTTPTEHHVCTEVVKGSGPVDPVELRDAVRAEVSRRMGILTAERKKFPPSLLKKGKRWVGNPKFTEKMRTHLHRFYVSSEEIRDALKAGNDLPEYPLTKGV